MKCWMALLVAIVTIQCISAEQATKLYVGNLSWNSIDDGLRQIFGEYGTVLDAIVMRDRDTGRSRGFGFVTMSTSDEADSAISALNETEFDGRRIRVNVANAGRPGRPNEKESEVGGFSAGPAYGGASYS